MARHIDTVAVMLFIYALLQLSIACMVGGIYGAMGAGSAVIGVIEGEEGMVVMGGVFVVIAVFLGMMMLLQPLLAFFAAVGLRRRTHLGRILAIIACALALLNIPLGTIVGIFGFVVLIDKEAAAEFSDDGREEYFT